MAAPLVQYDTLTLHEGQGDRLVAVGSPEWYEWLSRSDRFTYVGSRGTFAAYKEPRERGALYWRACRWRDSKLHRVYLGVDEHLSSERLEETAAVLGGDIVGKVTPIVRRSFDMSEPHREPSPPLDVAPTSAQEESQRRSLLRTKLSAPPGCSVEVARPRLLQRLSDVRRHKLTLVLAPPGYGKTTLLSQWARAAEHRVAWLTLDADDNNPVRFWTYFVSALGSQYPNIAKRLLDQLRSTRAAPGESFFTSLTNSLMTVDELVLVLDDYHVVQDQTIDEGVAALLTHLPPQVHLVISSRTEPALPLVRFRVAGQLLELMAVNLSFTHDESNTFLNECMQLGLSDEDTRVLHDRAEGWVAGLQFAALSLRDAVDVHRLAASFGGGHHHVVDYLVSEVLERQPETVREFLLCTSILESLNGQLCEAVCQLGPGNGQQMLEYLERTNLFTIASDTHRHWYRYHHLFAECLSTYLVQRQPELVPRLHRHASEWYGTNGLIAEAVRHALAANDQQLAATLIEQNASRLIKQGDLGTLLALVAALTEETVLARPWLCIFEVMALLNAGCNDAAEARLLHAERFVSSVAPTAVGPGSEDKDLAGIRAAVSCLCAAVASGRGDLRRSLALWSAGVQGPIEDNSALGVVAGRVRLGLAHDCFLHGDGATASQLLAEARQANNAGGSAYENSVTLRLAADVLIDKGQLRNAERTLRQALRVAADDATAMMSVSSVFVSLALLSYERNEIEAARQYAAEAEKAVSKGLQRHHVGVCRAMCSLKVAERDLGGAVALLDRAEEIGAYKLPPAELAWIPEQRVLTWLKQGDVKSASWWADASGIRSDPRLSDRPEAEQRALARVLIAEGRPADALPVIYRLLGATESAGRFGAAIATLVLCGIAQLALSETEAALNSLERALSHGEPEGYVRTFVDAGAPVAVMLSRMLKSDRRRGRSSAMWGTSRESIARLLGAFDAECEQSANTDAGEPRSAPVTSPLSEREQEVLRLIGLGWSRVKVARELVVSRCTIDSHLTNIYGKLNSHNRMEAVARATELHLL